MKKFFTCLLATMLIAAPTLFAQGYGQSLSQSNYPPNNAINFTQSNLPIVIISTDAVLSRTERKLGHMVVINNVDENGNPKTNYVDLEANPNQTIECDLPISIKWRGSTSFGSDESRSKKPMSIKTLAEGTTSLENPDKQKVKLLGMGKDNDWVLLAPWQDVSYVRDILTMVMAQGGSVFAPQMRYCEVVFNGKYYGVYILSERATKGKKRLNLWDYGCDADDQPLSEEDTTGDFQVEVDRTQNDYTGEVEYYYTSQYNPVTSTGHVISGRNIIYQYKHPEEEDFAENMLGEAARQAVHKAIDDMETAFKTGQYREDDVFKYIDATSFMDYEIAQEVSNNIDGYRLSTPMWKYSETHARTTGDNAKWKMALWDFNIAYGIRSINYYSPTSNIWRYTANDIMRDQNGYDKQLIPFYWYTLMNDNTYVQQLKERYTKRRKLNYTDARVNTICDSLKNLLQDAAKRDNSAWSNNFSTWSSEIDYVKSFTTKRLAWMDESWFIQSTEPEDPEEPTGKAVPLAIASGLNMDVICENHDDISGTVFTGTNCGIDASGFVFFTLTARQSGFFCKDDGLYSSSNADYQLDVTGNNALIMKENFNTGGTLTLATPAMLQKLYITGTSADGSSNVNVIVNYSDKSTSSTSFYLPNWDGDTSSATVAVSGLGRMAAIKYYGGEAGKFSSDNKFNVFELAISTDASKKVESVSFSHTSGRSAAIFSLSGVYATTDFQLTGTTFWKDNSWNTLCLPFDVKDADESDNLTFTGTPLEGAIVKTLASSNFVNGVLTLTFTDDLTSLKAGVPYIVKWEQSANVENPTFNDVVVKGKEQPAVTDYVDYIGSYKEIKLEGGDYTSLYLGANNTLYYPAEGHDITINPYHAYFKLKGSAAGENGASKIRAINIDFNDDPQGIQTIVAPTNELINYWYTLDGRRLDEKPTARGIYLHQGRRVMIK